MPLWSGASPLILSTGNLPEREIIMRKFALAVLLTFLLAGCSAVKLIAGPSEEPGSLPADSSKPASVSQSPSAPPATPDSSPSAAPASGESASSSAPETATAPSEETEEPAGQSDPFDAAEAVTVEAADGGIRVTFEQLPKTAQDLEALLALYPQSDARHGQPRIWKHFWLCIRKATPAMQALFSWLPWFAMWTVPRTVWR